MSDEPVRIDLPYLVTIDVPVVGGDVLEVGRRLVAAIARQRAFTTKLELRTNLETGVSISIAFPAADALGAIDRARRTILPLFSRARVSLAGAEIHLSAVVNT